MRDTRHPAAGHAAKLLLAFAGPLLAFLAAVGRPALDSDEALYLTVARNMSGTGDWIVPMVNGVAFLDKPPLLYWLTAIFHQLFGGDLWAMRAPGALAALACCWLLSRMAGTRAATMFGFCAGTFLFTLETMHDIFVLAFLILAAWRASLMLERGRASVADTCMLGVACAGAILSKGLVGLFFPVASIALCLTLLRDRVRVRPSAILAGVAVFVALAAPWHIAMEATRPGFLRHYFVNEQILRFLNRREPMDFESVPWPLFAALIPVWLFPWSAFAADAVRGLRGRMAESAALRYCVCWAGATFVFLSVSARLDHYSFLLLPPLAVILGSAVPGRRVAPAVLAVIGGLILLCGLAGLAWWNLAGGAGTVFVRDQANWGDFDPLLRLPAETIALLLWPFGFVTLGASAALLIAAHRLRRGMEWQATACMVAGMAIFFCAAAWSLRQCAPLLTTEAFAEPVRQADLLVVAGNFETANSLAFYTHTPIRLLDGTAPSLAGGLRLAGAPRLVLSQEEFRAAWSDASRRVMVLAVPEKAAALGLSGPVLNYAGRTLYRNWR